MAERRLEYNATLVSREDHTKELCTFTVRYDDPLDKTPPFLAGQYVAIGLNNEDAPEKGAVRRSMSIAGAPTDSSVLEFYVRFVNRPESENPLTHLLWKMKVGERIFVTRKPVGKFTLEATIGLDDPRYVLMVAAGTGLAPFVGMVRDAIAKGDTRRLKKFVLLHGASYPADICYRSELEKAASDHGLHYFPSVSRIGEAPEWKENSGRVEDFFLPDRLLELEKSVGVSPGTFGPAKAAVLICGLQGTIAKSIERLAKRGFVPFDRKIRKALALEADIESSVWWEQYDTTPVIDIADPVVVDSLRADLENANAI